MMDGRAGVQKLLPLTFQHVEEVPGVSLLDDQLPGAVDLLEHAVDHLPGELRLQTLQEVVAQDGVVDEPPGAAGPARRKNPVLDLNQNDLQTCRPADQPSSSITFVPLSRDVVTEALRKPNG